MSFDDEAPSAAPAPPPPPPPPAPAAPAAPAPAAPAPAAPAGATVDLASSLDVTTPAIVRAVTIGALAYAVAWIAALACTALVLVALQLDGEGADVSWSWLLTAPGQLVAMSFRSPARLSVTSTDDDFGFGATVSTTAPLLTLLVVALVAVFVLSRRDESSAPSVSTKGAVTLGAVSAATFVAAAWLIALVLKIGFTDDEDSTRIGAAGFQLILIGLLVVTLGAAAGRRLESLRSSAGRVPPVIRAAWRASLVQLAVFSALAIPAGIIWVLVEGEAATLLALPAVVLNVLVWAVSLGHLGAMSVSGFGSLMGESSSATSTFWLFTDDVDTVLWVLVPFAVIASLAAGVVLHERGRATTRTTSHWVWAALVFGAVGGALTVLGSVSTGAGSSFGAAGSARFGPAAWFLLVFAVWGLVAELVARVLGPALSSALPDAWVARLAGKPAPAPVGLPSGDGADTGAVAATAPPAPPAAPIDPRTKAFLIAAGGLVAVIAVAAVGVSIANRTFFGPENVVEDYFAALSEGDAERALDLARIDYPSDEQALLTDEILQGSAQRIEDVEIGDIQSQGDVASVEVTYSIDGAERSQDLTLRKSGSRLVLFDEWEVIDPSLDSLDLTAPGAVGLEVNGAAVEIDGLDDGVDLRVFPGTYEIAPTAGSSLLTFEPQTVTPGGDGDYLDFEVTATDALLAEVTTQVDAYVADCIARTEADPDGCPNDTFGGYDLTDVSWTLVNGPTYSLQPDYDGGWRFETDTPGSATITAKEPSIFDDEPAEDFTDTVELRLSGTVRLDGESVSVDVDDYF